MTTDPGHETRIENFHLAVQRLVESRRGLRFLLQKHYRILVCFYTIFNQQKNPKTPWLSAAVDGDERC